MLRNTKWGRRLTNSPPTSIHVEDGQLRLAMGPDTRAWDLVEISGIEPNRGLFWLSVTITPRSGSPVTVSGFPRDEGLQWVDGAVHALLEHLGQAASECRTVLDAWLTKSLPNGPATRWTPSWEAGHISNISPPRPLSTGHLYDNVCGHPLFADAQAHSNPGSSPLPRTARDALAMAIDLRNEEFYHQESKRPLFDSLEANPLTEEQRRSVIAFEKYLLVIAAAGSGKTAAMVAKAAYAIEAGLVRPEQILMLAFNSDAALEMRERVDRRLGHLKGFQDICCWTFHKFGLEVIGQATGKKPRPAPWLEAGQDLVKVSTLIEELSRSDSGFALQLMLFRMVLSKPLASPGAKVAEPDFDQKSGKAGFRTLNGEIVKSEEERLIADWLFFNGVEYQYETRYKHDTATATHSQYHPDFYYPAIDLYHEHFALSQHGQPPAHFAGYMDGVIWKRALHQEHGTDLVETTSYSLRNGDGFKNLQAALEARGLQMAPDLSRRPAGREPLDQKVLVSIIRTMMQHAKSNLLEDAELLNRASKIDPLRGPVIVALYQKVRDRWQEELARTGTVDFDDMINQAVLHAESFAFDSPFKLVVADEVQDSSYSRARLLRAVTSMPDVTLTVVGDDAQAINSFAGADIGVMRNFSELFPGGKVVFLTRTFRCPKLICDAATHFVQANPNQIRKPMVTTSTVEGNPLQCFALKAAADIPGLLEEHIGRITSKLSTAWSASRRPKIMVLGRYRRDKPKNWASLERLCGSQVELVYSTCHSSKGTEADYVMILNVIDRLVPNELVDDPIIQAAMPEPDTFPDADERRLFFVALTRAIRGAFIYTTIQRPSRFLTELQSAGWLKIVDTEGHQVAATPCPACAVGHQVERQGRSGAFCGCSRYPACRWTSNL
ncbi:UvrD-helicase domain-containing protein [Pseudomonas aeruginosa]